MTFLNSIFSWETFSSHHWKKLQCFLSRKAEHAKNFLPASDPLYRTNMRAGPEKKQAYFGGLTVNQKKATKKLNNILKIKFRPKPRGLLQKKNQLTCHFNNRELFQAHYLIIRQESNTF